MTGAKLNELEKKLAHLKETRPKAAAEVARLAELGDFSENAEYQLAKGRLRGLNSAIFNLEKQIHQATIIAPNKQTDTVAIGHTVTVRHEHKEKKFQILGSSEAKPEKGIISHLSPIGAALLGHAVGETIIVPLAGKEARYTLLKIE